MSAKQRFVTSFEPSVEKLITDLDLDLPKIYEDNSGSPPSPFLSKLLNNLSEKNYSKLLDNWVESNYQLYWDMWVEKEFDIQEYYYQKEQL